MLELAGPAHVPTLPDANTVIFKPHQNHMEWFPKGKGCSLEKKGEKSGPEQPSTSCIVDRNREQSRRPDSWVVTIRCLWGAHSLPIAVNYVFMGDRVIEHLSESRNWVLVFSLPLTVSQIMSPLSVSHFPIYRMRRGGYD